MTNKEKLTELFITCFLNAADPDGGEDMARSFVKDSINRMEDQAIDEMLKDIESEVYELIFDADYGEFGLGDPEDRYFEEMNDLAEHSPEDSRLCPGVSV